MSHHNESGALGSGASSWHPALRPNSLPPEDVNVITTDEAIPREDNAGTIAEEKLDTQGLQEQELESSQPSHTATDGPLSQTTDTQQALESHDTPWANEGADQDDPAWGFSSTTHTLQYTNSFPPVPDLSQQAPSSTVHPLPHSQAEAVIEEADSDARTDVNKDGVVEDRGPWDEQEGSTFNELLQPNDGTTVTRDVQEPSDAEARFEEGMPLVAKESEVSESTFFEGSKTESAAFNAFEEDPLQDDFFSNVGKPSESQDSRPPLDRKSTEQVLSSVTSNGLSADSALAAKLSEPVDLENSTGGGFAVSTSTVAAQVLADSLQELKDGEVTSVKGKEDDLDALWQAALGDDELLEDSMDPSSFFEDDGEGFLDDSINDTGVSPPIPQPIHDRTGQLRGFDSLSRTASDQYAPATSQRASAYVPSTPQPMPQTTQPYGRPAFQQPSYSHFGRPAVPQPPTPSAPGSTPQSFADKAKGGYTSPFDAPIDLTRPKRRPAQPLQPPQDLRSMPPPPPRSSSMVSPPANGSAPPPSRPPPSAGSYASSPQDSEPRPQSKSSASSFFEELPLASKPRAPSASARPSMAPPVTLPPRTPSLTNQASAPAAPQTDYGLVAPQRQMSFADSPQQPSSQSPYSPQPSKTAPPANTRYSPAPVGVPQESSNRGRYAGPPQAGGLPRMPSMSGVNPYQPRTSSPLLHSSSAAQKRSEERPLPNLPTDQSATSLQGTAHIVQGHGQPPPSQRPAGLAQGFDPSMIERPQVQQRGVGTDTSPILSTHGPQRGLPARPRRADTLQDERNFLPPTDGLEHDALRRWQGAPIFRFGFGGSVVTSFPKRVPRFSAGQAAPSVKCSPGGVNVHTSKLVPLDDIITTFPGPLRAKSKKKDVITWLNNGIARLEAEMAQLAHGASSNEHVKRREESLLLWKILRVFVEYDGTVDGNAAAVSALRQVLTPEVQHGASQNTAESYYQSPAIVHRESPSPATVRPGAVEEIRKLLLQGERENAVWFAADQKLWGHAMLIASTLSPELWKQVAQDFVKNEVKTAGDHVESLAALYDVFSGNSEESMDQLVPSAARAGLQMVSKTAASGPAKDVFDGLNRWRETLSMILSNRSAEDVRALASLGQLLLSYGRTEAAHICYLFARVPGLISGADDPQAAIVLLGENHRQRPFHYAQDLYSVLLTEVYEFAVCVLPSNVAPGFGHLQSFKLWHATMLAESGSGDQAQQYCDAIAATMKGSTKVSLYYHQQLFAAVEELSSRIRSAPRDGSGSWISKPNMDKVSGSMWNKFTSFVAGDESDAASVASKAEADGPFSRISGDTPSVSRGPSPGAEHFGSYGNINGYVPSPVKAASTNSRYAPKSQVQEVSGINRQPSVSSLGDSSPEFHRGYAPHTQAMPSQALAYPPKSSPSAASNHTGIISPMGGAHFSPSHITSDQRPAMPDTARSAPDAGISSPYAIGGPPYEAPPEGKPSPYEPRSAYAPRSNSYEPRSYQPSPKPEGVLSPPEISYGSPPREPRSVPAQASVDGEGTLAPQETPTIQQVPPTPTRSVASSAFGGAQAQPNHEPSAPGPESGGYEPPQSSYMPIASYEPTTSYEPSASSYAPPSASYDSTSSYEAPSYEPSSSYEPYSYNPPSATATSPTADSQDPAPKKKSIMDLSDDEDDLASRAEALKKAQRAANDRAADEAFRKAAEADAARAGGGPKLNSKPSGWLGGWFSRGAKGEDSAPAADSSGNKKPIKARLGEESSFYYDADLKKWVNRKAGAEGPAGPSAPTPPPPKGPPSRSASAAPPMGGPPRPAPTSNPSGPPTGGPPSAAVSRNASPGAEGLEGSAGPPAGPMAGMAVPPPSRPSTGMSGVSASSLDDLIGVPAPRKGGTVRKAKKKGYVDVMAK